MKKKGFTLIELLIVIVIITLLAAILFPVFASAREKARQSTCASNEKQIGLGFMQYIQDFDERMPISSGVTSSVAYDTCIQPYMAVTVQDHTSFGTPTNSTVFLCPDDVVAASNNTSARRTYSMCRPGAQYTGMGGVSGGCGTGAVGCLAMSQVPSPSGTFLLVENPGSANYLANSSGVWCDGPVLYSSSCTSANSNGLPNGTCYSSQESSLNDNALHTGGFNYLYGDGHVQWQRPETTIGTGTEQNPKGPWTIADGD